MNCMGLLSSSSTGYALTSSQVSSSGKYFSTCAGFLLLQASEVAQELEAMVLGDNLSLPKDVALYELGELFVREQEPERARGFYQRLVDEFPESPYRSLASQRLTELG